MVPIALSDVIAVGEVPTAEEITILAKAGFRAILLTQPENEVARLLSKAEVAAKASEAGLAFAYAPIVSRRPPVSDVDAFVAALSTLPRPIYACCYSGARTAAAWALAASRDMAPDAVMSACTAAGYDVSFLATELAARMQTPTVSVQREPSATAIPLAAIVSPVSATAAPASIAATAPDTAPPAIPALKPSVLPRAATAGGFAVAG